MSRSSSPLNTTALKKITGFAGVVSLVVVAFYATGLYRNYLEIQKLKKEKKNLK
tara:strand:- start:1352 stop:1513 length:162 start_codon:yes stop_codon:yes gene_type:complete